jgi:DNA topoisomerase I
VKHESTFANLDSVEEVFSVGLNRAVTVIAEKLAGGGRRGNRAAPKALKDLGEHPDGGGKITVRDGKYGPYVNHGKVNATLPKDAKPEEVTLEQAVALIAERAGKAPSKGRRKAAPKPKAKAEAGANTPKTKPKARTKPAARKKPAEAEPVDG